MGWYWLLPAALVAWLAIDFALFVRRGYRRKAEYEGRPATIRRDGVKSYKVIDTLRVMKARGDFEHLGRLTWRRSP